MHNIELKSPLLNPVPAGLENMQIVSQKTGLVQSQIDKIKTILKYLVYAQILLLISIAIHTVSGFSFGARWLTDEQLGSVVLEEKPVRLLKVNIPLVQCSMWQICDTHAHYAPQPEDYHRLVFTKEVYDFNSFLRKNANYRAFYAAQGIANKEEAIENFKSINTFAGKKVPDGQIKLIKQNLKIDEYAAAPAKPVKKLMFSIFCLICVAQLFFVIKGRRAVQYTKHLNKVLRESGKM